MSELTSTISATSAASGWGPALSSIKPTVMAGVSTLAASGVNISITNTPDQHGLTPDRQNLIDSAISQLEQSARGAEQLRSYSAVASWLPLTKRAVALHTLYNPDGITVGDGIDPEAYSLPIFGGKTAREIMEEQLGPERAARVFAAYENFLPAVIDDGGPNTVGSRDFFKGCSDAKAVRTRATAAMDMVASHIRNSPLESSRGTLVTASLGCGAAGPVYSMVKGLGDVGHNVAKVILVDQDPMALATAASLARGANIAGRIQIELRDLLSQDILGYIPSKSVDIVDLLGLFEYLPNDNRLGRLGSYLLGKVKGIIKPGGMILLGNMLRDRPQQVFFDDIVRWPRLYQRSIPEVLAIVAEAGFYETDVAIRVPREGVYAIYALKVPEL